MRGVVNSVYEATIPLTILGPNGQSKDVTAVIDTGYNGMLSLPLATVQELHLLPHVQRVVTLGDKSQKIMDFYQADVLWDGQQRKVRVLCVEGDPLVGTGLMKGYELIARFVDGGSVTIQLPG